MVVYPRCAMEENGNRREGRLVTWDDARGFGFAAVPGAEDVFVHVKALRTGYVRPSIGDELSFVVVAGRNGRPAARDVEIRGAPPPKLHVVVREPPPRLTPLDLSRLLAAPWILISAFLVVLLGRAPPWFGSLYLIMGAASALLYWFDKNYARAGRSRVREISMHLADAFFGIAGGLVAQHAFRHKTRKMGFRYITRLIFVFHATLLAALLGRLISFP
ncbi:MAG: cold shock and DUF1294 domain-containing protein [Alphaproteobacteria bacterium]|nr:cold shock and DUF1294 domain-containing protein [Alphaproteobacteria bacterium]